MSKSLSVISTLVDSAIDLLFNIILIWTARKIKQRDAYKYPTGRTRLEPVTIVILSVVMCSASIEAILFILCHRINNPTMQALAEDNRNDVASNSVALVCGIIGSSALHQKIRQEAIVVDPIGAIIISIYIIVVWIRQGHRQVRRLTGLTADPLFLQQITHVVYNFRPNLVTKIKTVRAVHHGTKFFVEVEIVMSGSMPLAIAHDIGEELQNQLHKVPDVERAFVHVGFEATRVPASEDTIV
ncbi:unnamed protein product [Rotaria sp. Silwood1]|nr:unnamed protein product [Rotaria sp. Silwood1]CAF1153739.1 unnamed protein product [Rotaria sp. Silwood1]